MVEGTPLLRVHPGKTWIEGSNPSVSASNETNKRLSGRFFVARVLPPGQAGPPTSASCTMFRTALEWSDEMGEAMNGVMVAGCALLALRADMTVAGVRESRR